jgi:predicted flap endonuclease-1-like 5' DNA nuclease
MASIVDIEGIGEAQATKLKAAGINTVEALLEAGASPKGREALATKADISPAKILEWVNHADLYRLKGVGSEYADLLEAAGVDSPPELARRVPANLVATMTKLNAEKKIVRKLPTLAQVTDWVEQSKKLKAVVSH